VNCEKSQIPSGYDEETACDIYKKPEPGFQYGWGDSWRQIDGILLTCRFLWQLGEPEKYPWPIKAIFEEISFGMELELELIQTQMAQKPMLRAEVGMRVRCANKASAEW